MALVVVFRNDGTGDLETGNYDVGVFLNESRLYKGRVEKHKRSTGWQGLVGTFVVGLRSEVQNHVADIR